MNKNFRNVIIRGSISFVYIRILKGVRVAVVFELTWNDIDFRNKTISVNKNIKSVSKRLGHRSIDFTYDIYVRVTEKMEKETANKFEEICKNQLTYTNNCFKI